MGEPLWKRPESVPVPTVWARFESKKTMSNGRAPRFRIQDYSDEWKDQVINNMENFFLKDEPLCQSLRIKEDSEAVEEFKAFFLKFLERRMALIAVVENLDELGDKSLPALAGCNITAVVSKNEEIKKSTSGKIQTILDALGVLEAQKNCFAHYNVTEYMYAFGLSVDSAYRGHGLGFEILKARFPLCRAVGIKVTVTTFTAAAAQRSAEKAGFETLAEIPYSDYKDSNGQVIFKVDVPKSMKLMGIRLS